MADEILTFREEATGICNLGRVIPRPDPEGSGTVILDVDLVTLVDEERAQVIAGIIPDAPEHVRRAVDGKASVTVTVRLKDAGANLTFRTQDGDRLVSALAEIRQLTLKLTDKSQVFTAKVRLLAVPTALVGKLLAHLQERLLVDVQPTQLQLDLTGPPNNALAVGVRPDGVTVCGIVTNRSDEDERIVLDDFGVIHVLSGAEAWVHLSDGWRAHAEAYRSAVIARDGNPTWEDILPALGAMATAQGGDVWTLDGAVVDRATQNARIAS